eukprot:SAG31_NODE_870_length_11338_cov_14.525047_10_plen_307_part_00
MLGPHLSHTAGIHFAAEGHTRRSHSIQLVSMKTTFFTVLFVLGGGAHAQLQAGKWIKQLGVSCLLAGGGAGAGGSAAAPDYSHFSSAVAVFIACDTTSDGDGRAPSLPFCESYDSNLYMLQAEDVLSLANLTDGAAAAAPSCGSPGSPLDSCDLYMCYDLLRGSGGESVIGIPAAFVGELGRAVAQPFPFLRISIRCDSALRSGGGGGGSPASGAQSSSIDTVLRESAAAQTFNSKANVDAGNVTTSDQSADSPSKIHHQKVSGTPPITDLRIKFDVVLSHRILPSLISHTHEDFVVLLVRPQNRI